MDRLIILLRGINVGGNKRVPMAELRALAVDLGYESPRTYIASGNLIVDTDVQADVVRTAVERALADRFGFSVEVVVRTASQWRVYAAGGPFREAAAARPSRVMLGLSVLPPNPDAVATLTPYATAGERIEMLGDALWADFPDGSGRSKITPAVLARAVGSSVTARNWRTVLKLAELVG